ncbi:hypothetical protein EST38_g3994 [Candolleomyces aberdarensis]|uniref:Vacuolar sorting protein 39/Transforming growth factor beta receptor-associated domain-containing protein n=1 Tax=Candolleomyces aberdarensis TaxID=2316362 RepID=A0A4Q2DP56_9AGAR|nr:hypothetical protein EST38_g3994 [Candolleomyces aberdarensis]
MSSSSHVLLIGTNSVESLVPSSLISQVESLLGSHRLEDAFNLADSRRKKLEESIEVDEDETEELRYIYQRIGFQYFTETLFEDAGNNFFNGQLDPRVLVSYYPDLRGNLFGDGDNVDLFAGVAEHMPKEASVEDIIAFNLVRNYSPHLPPNTRSAPTSSELRRILQERAVEMLENFLKKERRRRIAMNLDDGLEEVSSDSKGKGKQEPHSIRVIIDTVLAKLYARSEKTSDLYDLLLSSSFVVLSEVEEVFKSTGQYNALCIIYQKGGDVNDEKLLEVWAKIVDGEWVDQDIPDPLLQMISLLTSKRDKALTQRWAIWLTKRDPEAGIRLLTTLRDASTGRRKKDRMNLENDMDLLRQLAEASPAAGKQYLEHIIFQKRTNSKELHTRFALLCIDEVLQYLNEDEAISKLWKAKTSSYTASATSKSQKAPQLLSSTSSFLSHFASTTPDSPSKRSRLRAILFLSGSQFYDPASVKVNIEKASRGKLLALESAVLEGKLGNHKSALYILACELRDALSAEAYCSLGGDVIPTKVAISIAEGAALREWIEVLFPGQPVKGSSKVVPPQSLEYSRSVDGKTKRDLLKILLEVYLGDESPISSERAAQLINSQAMNLDVLTVISMVPPSWPLPSLSSFLSRSFRRITHQKREGEIAKNISSGQNLEVKELTYEPVREAGALLEEELQMEADPVTGEYDEKKLNGDGANPASVVEIVPGHVPPEIRDSLLFSEKDSTAAATSGLDDDIDGLHGHGHGRDNLR